MPTIPLHISPHISCSRAGPPPADPQNFLPFRPENPLPEILKTPTGLALLEIQGTLNLPAPAPSTTATPVGQLVFPHYDPSDITGSTAWMKTVHLYVGPHQRLTGEIKKLPKAIAVLRKKESGGYVMEDVQGRGAEMEEELEIVEIVEWKILFSSRPEPVAEGLELRIYKAVCEPCLICQCPGLLSENNLGYEARHFGPLDWTVKALGHKTTIVDA